MKRRTAWYLVAFAFMAGIVVGHGIGTYNAANKGVTLYSCGYEYYGHPGLFCGDY